MMQHLNALLVVAAALLGPQTSPADESAATSAPTAPLARVAIVGASLSAGTGNAAELELRKDAKLGVFLRAALADQHAAAEVHDFGDTWFFRNPLRHGPKQLAEALETDPTVLVASDFLFWFAYGDPRPGDPRRSTGLAHGLGLLDAIDLPLVIGDLPRIDHALRGKGPLGAPIVRRSMFPTEDERAAMNETIRAWAAARDRVVVVPLDALVQGIVDGKEMRVADNSWKPASIDEVLQQDLLHPNVRGGVWSAMQLAQTMTELEGISTADFRWDEVAIAGRVREQTAEPRAEAKRKREKAEARRLAREKRKAQKEAHKKKEKVGGGG